MKSYAEEQLKRLKPRSLSTSEREQLWLGIEQHVLQHPRTEPVSMMLPRFRLAPVMLSVVAVVFGGSVLTAAAANTARPGDPLFGLDLAIERVQLKIVSSDDQQLRLKLDFAQERVKEMEGILAANERKGIVNDNQVNEPSSAPVVTNKDLNRTWQALTLSLKYLQDVKDDFSATGKIEAAAAVDQMINQLTGVTEAEVDDLEHVKIEIEQENDDQKTGQKIEIITKDLKSKFKIKKEDHKQKEDDEDDERKVNQNSNESRTPSNEQGERGEEEDEDEPKNINSYKPTENSNRNTNQSQTSTNTGSGTVSNPTLNVNLNTNTNSSGSATKKLTEAEAEVSDGRTRVAAHYGGTEEKFTLNSTDRASVVTELVRRYNITTAEADAVLKFHGPERQGED